MGNYCKNCTCTENNKNTMVMISENEELKNEGLVLVSNRKNSSDSVNKTKIITEEKKLDNKYLNDFEILEKNLNGYKAQKLNSNNKREKIKFLPDTLLKHKTNENKKTEINIVILGDSEVGKSCFAIQLAKNKFEQYHVVTIGTEHAKTYLNCNDSRYTLNLTITSGVSQYKTDYTSFFENADFFLIFFDVSKLSSFSNIPNTIQEIENYLFKYKNDTCNVIIVGNKCELKNREISKDEAKNFCLKISLKYYEISVKSKINIQALIEDILCTYHNF